MSETPRNACATPDTPAPPAARAPPCVLTICPTMAGLNTCTMCPLGLYSTVTAASAYTTCVVCPANTFSVVQSASATATCVECPAGLFTDAGSAVCRCALGDYVPAASTTCTSCGSGSARPRIVQLTSECLACSADRTSKPGSSNCTLVLCVTGNYVSTSGD